MLLNLRFEEIMSNQKYLDATQEAGRSFYMRGIQGEVTMLNLLKFKPIADYSEFEHLAPDEEITGEQAYQLYIEHTLPFLHDAGGEILFQGKGGGFLIGPDEENWDLVLLVKHKDVATFMEFAQNKEYLKGLGHRTAALEDSRLLPIEENHLT